jgi:hypothetical protein
MSWPPDAANAPASAANANDAGANPPPGQPDADTSDVHGHGTIFCRPSPIFGAATSETAKGQLVRRLFTALAIVVLGLTSMQTPALAADPIYRIVNLASADCLDQDYTGGTPHATMDVWQCLNPGDNQKWRLHAVTSTVSNIINVRSGQCLDQDYSGQTIHLKVTAHQCNGGNNQTFVVSWDPSSHNARIFVPLSPDGRLYCLDQDYSGGQPHSGLLVYLCNGGNNQKWTMNEV